MRAWQRPLLLAALLPGLAQAATTPIDYATPAEALRAGLSDAQLELAFDSAHALTLTRQAEGHYRGALAQALHAAAPEADAEVRRDLHLALTAAQRGDAPAFARARAGAWTALLGGAYQALESNVREGRAGAARDWLALREFRPSNRYTRLHADATVAVEGLAAGTVTPGAALTAIRADLLDGYQARLGDALAALGEAQAAGYRTRGAEQAALAQGYFALLAPAFGAQRGEVALRQAEAQFAALPQGLTRVQALMAGFRAAPLSERERRLRAGQVTRYLNLVPVEYARGVTGDAGGVVVKSDIEITEATTFLAAARGAYADLSPLIADRAGAEAARQAFAQIGRGLAEAAHHGNAPTGAALQGQVQALGAQLDRLFPEAWRGRDASGDLDVIRSQLDALKAAVLSGDYAQAETARLDAYATLESGPEARVSVFAPDLKVRLEDLFWNGARPAGLAALVRQRATPERFAATRSALDAALAETAELLGTDAAPPAVATNAGIIVFREGLEAVLILAALMGSFRKREVRHLRRPMWWGGALALAATAITWAVLGGTLSLLARFGEKLEAVVGVIAIVVLLLIMNWFFHQVYWTDRMAGFQRQKHQLMGREVGQQLAQWLGLTALGFTSIYREGFETVLFLQSLVLQSGRAPVLTGTAVGLLAVAGVGVLVFALQAKLPMKKLLVYTGGLICLVLFVMVGNTTHVLQLVGWFPVHALPVSLPAQAGVWLGLYPSWEGVLLQVFAVVAVIGSYFLSEGLKQRTLRRRVTPATR